MPGRTEEELQRIAESVFDFVDGMDGVNAFMAEWDADAGLVTVGATTRDPEALRAVLAGQYGDVVKLSWAGPDEYVPRPTSFERWTIAADDRTLTVYWLGGVAEPLPLEFRETPDAVEVLLQELAHVGPSVAVGIGRRQTGVLPSPLAGRDVIDATPPDRDDHPEEDLRETTLERALRHFAERDFAQAERLFERVAAESPDAFADPALDRKRRIAAKRASRERDA